MIPSKKIKVVLITIFKFLLKNKQTSPLSTKNILIYCNKMQRREGNAGNPSPFNKEGAELSTATEAK